MPTAEKEVTDWHTTEINRLTNQIKRIKQVEPDAHVLETLRAQLRAHLIDLNLEEL